MYTQQSKIRNKVYTPVPNEVKRFNWGALLLTPIWAIRYRIWFGLLCFIPFVGFTVPFILGFCGSSWAWRYGGHNQSVEEFVNSQRRWGVTGILFACVVCGVILG